MTAAARRLHTSQPGVSRQIALLEEELGFQIFERQGRSLVRTTEAGENIVGRASVILRELQNIRRTSSEWAKIDGGALSIGTTHTQARYVLPEVVRQFRARYPKVHLHLHQGTPEQIKDMVSRNTLDVVIAAGSDELFPHWVRLPVYRCSRTVVVPKRHALTTEGRLSLRRLADFPIVTYEFSLSGRSSLAVQFETAGLALDVALTARDADVIKTYVRIGLGVGILASVAFDPTTDEDLVALDASHLFEDEMAWFGFRRGSVLRAYMYDFIELLAPHLTRKLVRKIELSKSLDAVKRITDALEVPVKRTDRKSGGDSTR